MSENRTARNENQLQAVAHSSCWPGRGVNDICGLKRCFLYIEALKERCRRGGDLLSSRETAALARLCAEKALKRVNNQHVCWEDSWLTRAARGGLSGEHCC